MGIESTDEEIKDLFEACDIYEHMGMKFNEFIVFLCLVYLLNEPAVSEAVSFISHINSHSNILIVLLVLLSHCMLRRVHRTHMSTAQPETGHRSGAIPMKTSPKPCKSSTSLQKGKKFISNLVFCRLNDRLNQQRTNELLCSIYHQVREQHSPLGH